MLDDDLGLRVNVFQLSDEGDRFARVALGILRVADHERELRSDPDRPQPAGQLQGLAALELLVHRPQHPVRARLGPEEDHGGAGLAQALECVVGVGEDDVDPSLAPEAEPERREPSGQIARVLLPEEEVVVVELDRVDAVALFEMAQDRGGARRGLHPLEARVGGDDAAEVAAVGAADARVVRRGAGAEVGGEDVVRGIEPVIRGPWEIVRRPQPALGIVDVVPGRVLVGETADRREIPRAAQGGEQLEKRVLSLGARHEIDVGRLERGVGIERREVATPDDRDRRVARAEDAAQRQRRRHLGAGHHRYRQQLGRALHHVTLDLFPGLGLDVAVDDRVRLLILEHRGQVKDR